MSIIDYFKLQAKNLMRDWETHQDDEELGYVYSPKFFDIDGLLIACGEDETKFCLQRAQHLIAQLAGYKKWNELIKASEEELRLAKIVFDGCKERDDMVTASEEWKMYYYSNNIGNLPIDAQQEVAKNYFEESEGDIPTLQSNNKEKSRGEGDKLKKPRNPDCPSTGLTEAFRPLFTQIEQMVGKIKPSLAYLESALKKTAKYSDGLSDYLNDSIIPFKKQIESWGEETSKIYRRLDEIQSLIKEPIERIGRNIKDSYDYPAFSEIMSSINQFDSITKAFKELKVFGNDAAYLLQPLIDQEKKIQSQISSYFEKEKKLQDYILASLIH